jgi:predicted DNA binding CopG/RHH family protein
MKKPKLSDLRIDAKGTKAMREKMAKAKKIKITINIDEDVLESVRGKADESGIPYQSLLNRLLRDAVEKTSENDSRLEKLEREVQALKKKVSA